MPVERKTLLSLTLDERQRVAEQLARLLADEIPRRTDVLSPVEWAFVDALARGVKPEDLSTPARKGLHSLIGRVAPPRKRHRKRFSRRLAKKAAP
jgi:hypothetical protein